MLAISGFEPVNLFVTNCKQNKNKYLKLNFVRDSIRNVHRAQT